MIKTIKNEKGLHQYWEDLFKSIPKYEFDSFRVENKIGTGTPDRSYEIGLGGIRGWIEFKVIETRKGPGKIKAFTPVQKRFLLEHGNRAGHCWLLIFVKKSGRFYIFNYTMAQKVENFDLDEFEKYCSFSWDLKNYPVPASLISLLFSRK